MNGIVNLVTRVTWLTYKEVYQNTEELVTYEKRHNRIFGMTAVQ